MKNHKLLRKKKTKIGFDGCYGFMDEVEQEFKPPLVLTEVPSMKRTQKFQSLYKGQKSNMNDDLEQVMIENKIPLNTMSHTLGSFASGSTGLLKYQRETK